MLQLNGPILRISNIRVEDRGVYICSVQSSEGSSRTSAIIEVERKLYIPNYKVFLF